MNLTKSATHTRILSLFTALTILLTALFICTPASFADESASPTVYVSPEGSDDGDGTKDAPFYTVKKAYNTIKKQGKGTVVIMGDIEPDNATAWNDAKNAWDAVQTGTITITGRDPETGEIYPDAKLRYNAIGLVGPTVLDCITLVPFRTSCFINTCGYELTVNEVLYENFSIQFHDGIGETKKGTVSGTNSTMNGGSINIWYMGGGYPTSTAYGVTGDVRFTMNDGALSRISVGFDKFNSTHTTGRIDGNVIITINGGAVSSIQKSRINDDTVGGFVALIFNNNTISSYDLPDGKEGVFVIHATHHGNVQATDEAGVFAVTPDTGYSAYVGNKAIGSGNVTFEEGETFVKFIRDGVHTEVGFETSYADGFPDGTFRPDEALSRAEAVALAVKATTEDSLVKRKHTATFTDIYKSDWYYDSVAYLEYLGMLPESWSGSFEPSENMTRGEFVYILDNLISYFPTSVKLMDFSDVTKDNPYYSAISNATKSGLVTGYPDGLFRPDYPLTRAEAVTVINRFLERTPVSGASSEFSDVSGHWASEQIAAAASDYSENKWEKGTESVKYVMPAAGTGAENYVKALYAQSAYLSGEAIRDGVDVIAEQMKKDILYTENTDISGITGSIYYVSEKNGDDANNGTTAPIKTLSRLSKLSVKSGDAVLFERGGIYRGTIASKSGVTYGSYGEGNKPLIMQSKKNYADKSFWETTEWENVYVCTELLTNVGVIGFDHDLFDYSEDSYNELYADIMNLNTLGFTGPSDLSEDLQFYSVCTSEDGATLLGTPGKLYVYSTEGNPGERFTSIEIGERFDIFDGNPNNCTIDNIAIKFTGAHAIGFGTCQNLKVTNCVFSWLGGSVLKLNSNKTAVNYGNAVEIYGGCDGYLVKNNWMYQIYDTGVTHQRSSSTGNCIQTNIEYNSNFIEYVHWGIEFYNAPPTAEQLDGKEDTYTRYTSNVKDLYNVCRMGGYGWGSITRFRQKSARLYCGATLSDNYNQYTHYNIFDRCAGYLINLPKNSTEDDDRNIYIQDVGCTLGLLKGTLRTCSFASHEDIKKYLGDEHGVVVVIEKEIN